MQQWLLSPFSCQISGSYLIKSPHTQEFGKVFFHWSLYLLQACCALWTGLTDPCNNEPVQLKGLETFQAIRERKTNKQRKKPANFQLQGFGIERCLAACDLYPAFILISVVPFRLYLLFNHVCHWEIIRFSWFSLPPHTQTHTHKHK